MLTHRAGVAGAARPFEAAGKESGAGHATARQLQEQSCGGNMRKEGQRGGMEASCLQAPTASAVLPPAAFVLVLRLEV